MRSLRLLTNRNYPSGAKSPRSICDPCGTTEVAPFQKTRFFIRQRLRICAAFLFFGLRLSGAINVGSDAGGLCAVGLRPIAAGLSKASRSSADAVHGRAVASRSCAAVSVFEMFQGDDLKETSSRRRVQADEFKQTSSSRQAGANRDRQGIAAAPDGGGRAPGMRPERESSSERRGAARCCDS